MKEREEAERQWVAARMEWVAGQLEGGVWKCGVCGELLRLTREEESRKVMVRCTGTLGSLGTTASGGGTNHWPVLMERVGDIFWEPTKELPERRVAMTSKDWRTKRELNGEDE